VLLSSKSERDACLRIVHAFMVNDRMGFCPQKSETTLF
jgi:hypothetical protein